ncbi:MAG: hypothetical protein GY943_11340 [Chloroflexi bacterium]|nr:hypothetical protein [Chloroflexota bacterium]
MKQLSGLVILILFVFVAVLWGKRPFPTNADSTTYIYLPIIQKPGTPPSSYCPAYIDSTLYRSRAKQITLNPADDWMNAIQNAAPDTEILLLDGTYAMGSTLWLGSTSNLTIRSASGNRDAVILQGPGYGLPVHEGFAFNGHNITIADLTMTDIRNHAISIKSGSGAEATHIYNVHLVDIGTQHIKGSGTNGIEDGIVACSRIGYTDGGVEGDYINGIDIHGAIDWEIRDNALYNIFGDGSGCEVDIDCGTYLRGGGPAILLWNNASGNMVERNQIINSFRGIALGLGSGHEGGIVRNNFFYQAEAARTVPFGAPITGDMGIQLITSGSVLVEHNTIILGGNYPGAIEVWNPSGHVTIQNNLITVPIWDRGSASFSQAGNIIDATVADLRTPGYPHVPVTSRVVGAGVATALDHDIDGDERNGRFDVGADQVTP